MRSRGCAPAGNSRRVFTSAGSTRSFCGGFRGSLVDALQRGHLCFIGILFVVISNLVGRGQLMILQANRGNQLVPSTRDDFGHIDRSTIGPFQVTLSIAKKEIIGRARTLGFYQNRVGIMAILFRFAALVVVSIVDPHDHGTGDGVGRVAFVVSIHVPCMMNAHNGICNDRRRTPRRSSGKRSRCVGGH